MHPFEHIEGEEAADSISCLMMTSRDPLISVLMPAFNAQAHIASAIRSILNQTFREFELLVVDDGSTDTTTEIVSRTGDPRVRLIPLRENHGLASALNVALRAATSPYVARMDADDGCASTRLETQKVYLDANPGIGICGTFLRTFGAGRTRRVVFPTAHEDIVSGLLFESTIGHPTTLMRRDALLSVGGYTDGFRVAEDYDLWIRLKGHVRFSTMPKVLYHYRRRSGQLTTSSEQEYDLRRVEIWIRLLEELGTDDPHGNVQLHRQLAMWTFPTDCLGHLTVLHDWLLHLLECNTSMRTYDSRSLRAMLSKRFFHICTFFAHHGLGGRNIFSKLYLYRKADISPRLTGSQAIRCILKQPPHRTAEQKA